MNRETMQEEAKRSGISVSALKRRKKQELEDKKLRRSEFELREKSAGWNQWAGSKGVRHA